MGQIAPDSAILGPLPDRRWIGLGHRIHADLLPESLPGPSLDVLDALAGDLTAVADALRAPESPGARRAVAETIRRGNDGVERLPGKHGQNRRFEQLVVMVDDTPGQLGRLFGELGELDVNVEDLRLEHSPGAQFGLADISVDPAVLRHAVDGLVARGWKIASLSND